MERWREHYSELYFTINTVSETALGEIAVDLDAPPTRDELAKVLNTMANRKDPGNDGIPPEVLKQGKLVLPKLHELLFQIWNEGKVKQSMRVAILRLRHPTC